MSVEGCEWLEGYSTAYLVESVNGMKAELLRRGLDECGVVMPILRTATAQAMEIIDVLPVPLRAHHDCLCNKSKPYHDKFCPVAESIREAARHDRELHERVVTIKVRGRVEVES